MSGVFSGAAIPPFPTEADTTVNQPLWYQSYLYNTANAATNLANSPYQPVPFPQVATPSSATQQAWQMAGGNVGNYQPALNQATNLAGLSANAYLGGALENAIGQAGNAYNEAGANTSYLPPLTQAMGQTAAYMQPIGASQINQYMSPYTSDVVGALQQASNQNLFQNVMPQLQSEFVSAGQAESPQEMQAATNQVYQSQQALNQATAQALQSGYQGALNTAVAEQQAGLTGANQLAGQASTLQQLQASNIAQQLQAAGQAGGLGVAQAQGLGQAAAQQGELGALTQQLGGYDVGQMAAAGQGQDIVNQANINAALNNFYAQQQWPYQNLAFSSNILRGQNIPSNVSQVGQAYLPGNNFTASPLQSFVSGTLGTSALLGGGFGNSNNAGTTSTTPTYATGAAHGGHVTPMLPSPTRKRQMGTLERYAMRKAA